MRNFYRFSLALTCCVVLASSATAGGRPFFSADLTDAENVPPFTSPTSAQGRLTIRSFHGSLDYSLSVSNLLNAFAAHIHCGPVGEAGPIGVTLFLRLQLRDQINSRMYENNRALLSGDAAVSAIAKSVTDPENLTDPNARSLADCRHIAPGLDASSLCAAGCTLCPCPTSAPSASSPRFSPPTLSVTAASWRRTRRARPGPSRPAVA